MERKSGYCENDELGGADPYSASKAAAENIFNSYLIKTACKNYIKNISDTKWKNLFSK